LYKYVAVAIIVFVSGLLLPLPSNTLLLASGAFASQGYMNVSVLFFVALISNVLGDSCGYALTRFWGTRIITEKRMQRYSAVAKVERFVRDHARPTILVTRFLGTPGVIVNFFCGLNGVTYRRFVLYDIIGNTLDIGGFLFLGYTLGIYSDNYSNIATLVGWIVFILALIFIIVRFFLKRRKH
jgi:membrane-associated protein